MGFAGRRAETAIADLAKVVATLTPTAGYLIDLADAFG
jgi:hypothetical protein